MRLTLHLPALAVGSLFISGFASGAGALSGDSPLQKPPDPPNPDAAGTLSVSHDPAGVDQLSVTLANFDPFNLYDLHVESAPASGTLAKAGSFDLSVGEGGELVLSFLAVSPALPGGASSALDLGGRAVEVRSADTVFLIGSIPVLADPGGGGGSGGGGDAGGSSRWQRGSGVLVRPIGDDSHARGRIRIAFREKGDRHRLSIEAEHLPAGELSVFLESAVGSAELLAIGSLSSSAASHGADDGEEDEGAEAQFAIDTKAGDELPLGAAHLAELSLRRVEIRDAADAVLLHGVVPVLDAAAEPFDVELPLIGFDGARGEVELRGRPAGELFAIKLSRMPKGKELAVQFGEPGSSLSTAFTMLMSASGKGKFRADSRQGDPLPLGVASLRELSGLAFEICDPSQDGKVLLSGVVPQF